MNQIKIQGAHLHNLKEIDVTIPKNKLIAATGVSGSGKSSLVFDIIFEEGRKLYLQSLGVHIGLDEEEKFEKISGIGPTIAVQQNIIRQSNPRSTVGSRIGILNMLSILYAVEGDITCRTCGTITDKNQSCKKCGNIEERLPTGYFSYNNPNGMCLNCSGRGAFYQIDMQKLVPDKRITFEQILNSIRITRGLRNVFHRRFNEYLETPFMQIPDEVQADILYGHFEDSNAAKRSICLTRILEGHIRKYGKDPTGFYRFQKCPECHGFRIGEEARRVHLNGRHIGELGTITLTELYNFIDDLLLRKIISESRINPFVELLSQINGLIKARLGHLSLYREVSSLSGGEMQRLFLTSHLDTKMDSVIYILDEPTAGLHEKEKEELLNSIIELKNLGNTVIIVEHDRKMIEAAEHIIDLGPEAGKNGGELIYNGDLAGLLNCSNSITGRYFSGETAMPLRKKIVIDKKRPALKLLNAKTNNLKNVNVWFPLDVVVGIAGLSGSGKSSLIADSLVPLLKECLHDIPKGNSSDQENNNDENQPFLIETIADQLDGIEHINGFAEVSQKPIGRNKNSNPVTYIGIWDKIRKVFAGQADAVEKALTQGHFSFNSKGACSSCSGSGIEKIWLGGNMFVSNTCQECQGTRYNNETLSVKHNNKNIHDILELSVSEAVDFFKDNPGISSSLQVMERIGMGYIKLGQPTPTLSGGETQRIKLAKEICRKRKGGILYIFDEPTAGLSMYDTAKLILLLDELVEKGNSVIVIEHDTSVLSACDWIIELGPEGGVNGGSIIAEGTPETLRDNPESVTGAYLL